MIFALSIIIVFAIYLFLFGKKTQYKQLEYLMFGLFVIALSTIAYKASPDGDLSRHFRYMGIIRESGISLRDIFTGTISGFEHNRIYFVFELICYLCAKIGNYHLMPCAMVFVDYLIWSLISIDFMVGKKCNYNVLLCSLLLLGAFMPYIFALSGVRNATAMSLTAASIYLLFEKKSNYIIVIILYIIAVFIHPSVLFAVPFIFISKLKYRNLYILISFLSSFLLNRIAVWCLQSKYLFLRIISNYYLIYSSDTQYVGSLRYLYVDIAFAIIIIFVYIFFDKKNYKKDKYTIIRFVTLYVAFVMGNIGNYDLVIRPLYLMGPLATPIVYYMFCDKWISNHAYLNYFIKKGIYLFMCVVSIWLIYYYLTLISKFYF